MQLGGIGNPLRTVQEIPIWPHVKMRNPESFQENKTKNIVWDFKIQKDHSIPTRRPVLVYIAKKKELVIWWVLMFLRTAEGKWNKKVNIWILLESWKKAAEQESDCDINNNR